MAHRSGFARVIAVCLAMCATLFAPQLFAQNFNYGEALQKSLFFYEAQRSGDLPADQPRQLARRLRHSPTAPTSAATSRAAGTTPAIT